LGYKLSTRSANLVYEGLKEAGVDFVVTLPDGWLREIIAIVRKAPEWVHVPIHREEEGVGIAAGAYLGGKKPAMIIQNSGLGNSLNALASLNMVHRIPLLLLMSDRGHAAGEVRGHFLPLGQAVRKILRAIGIPCFELDRLKLAKQLIAQAQGLTLNAKIPVALLLSKNFVEGSG
jgi:sulfopyruvate decarboxylase subunit alpha